MKDFSQFTSWCQISKIPHIYAVSISSLQSKYQQLCSRNKLSSYWNFYINDVVERRMLDGGNMKQDPTGKLSSLYCKICECFNDSASENNLYCFVNLIQSNDRSVEHTRGIRRYFGDSIYMSSATLISCLIKLSGSVSRNGEALWARVISYHLKLWLL